MGFSRASGVDNQSAQRSVSGVHCKPPSQTNGVVPGSHRVKSYTAHSQVSTVIWVIYVKKLFSLYTVWGWHRGCRYKLEFWGKAQRESARRPKSDWGAIWGGEISPAPKSRGPNSNALAYAERALSTQGRSTWALITLFVEEELCWLCNGKVWILKLWFVLFYIYNHNVTLTLYINWTVFYNVNINYTVKLADSKNHTLEPKITTLSYTQPELWPFK